MNMTIYLLCRDQKVSLNQFFKIILYDFMVKII